MKKPLFTGSNVAIVTPMYEDESVNFEKLGELIEFHIANGTSAITICGTTGEAPTLKDPEHLAAIKYTVEKVAGRIPVIAGTGSNYTSHAIEFSQEAAKYGADGVLLVTPYYNKSTPKGLIRHYTKIVDSANIPAILYNVPSRTGVSLTVPIYKELSKHPLINGVKEASGSTDIVLRTLDACGDDLNIWSGNDNQIVPFMAMGAKGVISVLANICPKETAEMADACLAGDYQKAAAMQISYMELIDALFCEVNPIPVKTAMNLIGMNAGPLRLPLCEMEDSNVERLKKALLAKGFTLA
ncbi:MAG: 4-hydroxy-tetrahydrodipicolinate synthase [Oscillospiraceae bacterium]|nr:4-hydroxy-tetrahydrodipicolinate synthase [Oscillospiraceae bacterium]